MRWDPIQYTKYSDERGRPFHELLERVGATKPSTVIDLGCGPGQLTALLADRWPDARVTGVDSSPEMIAQAEAMDDPRLRFELGDITTWVAPADTDVVISNAALQWVPNHVELLHTWATSLPPGAWLAWQVPGNFSSPSHELMRQLATSPRWADRVGNVLRHHDVQPPSQYAELLLAAGWSADAWQTTYTHILSGPDPVLEWLRGTGLRPVLNALDGHDPTGADRAAFEREFAALLRQAYPPTPHGTLLEFRRIFAVGHKPT
jgi:trans-aconitate 2-methyltransferase